MFDRLKELSLQVETQVEETEIMEAKSMSGDFEGIRSVIEDSLADLHDKVSMLMDMAKDTGAIALDTVKDKDGHTVFKKIDKLTKDYKMSMDKLMMEAETMVMQVVDRNPTSK